MTGVGLPSAVDAARTAAELRAKLTGLTAELGDWRNAAGREQPLRRHHTQIEAVAGTLGQAAADLTGKLNGADQGTWILDRAGAIDSQIMDLHRLWGFFRGKFALRYVPWLEAPLVALDDLAWACYQPAQDFVAPDRRREPPLLYFTGGTSPFLVPRGSPYVVEPLPDGSLREPQFAEAVRLVPVALIGVPWFQADHLPDAPLLGHEVGHAVEQDLGLGPDVRALIESAVPPARRAAWVAWSGETFADVYGTLCCGSGFARALMALLAGHPREVAQEARGPADWGSYPTRTLRVLLTAEVLTKLGVQPAGPPIAGIWRGTYTDRPLGEYEDDAGAVAAALLDGPYEALNGAALTAVMPYTDDDEAIASKLATRLLAGATMNAGGVRHIMAAARLAYDRDRNRFASSNAAALARAEIADIPSDGVRASDEAAMSPDELRAERGQRDQAAGNALADLFGAAAGQTRDQEAADVPT
jgi:hypothetical protein